MEKILLKESSKRVGPKIKKKNQRALSWDSVRFEELSQKKVQGKASDLEHLEWLRIKQNLQAKELDEINMLRIQAKERYLKTEESNKKSMLDPLR